MNTGFLSTCTCLTLFATISVVVPAPAGAAPRGSAVWCEQMMDKPRNTWSINDRIAFDDHCKAQKSRWYKAVERQHSAPLFTDKQNDQLVKQVFKDGLAPGAVPANPDPPH
jgi:Protein of unknown function (DUF3012)